MLPTVLLACLLAPLAQDPFHATPHPGSRFEVPPEGASAPLFDWGGRPVIEVRSGDATLRLIVDTGSSAVLVLGSDAAEADELRLGAARLASPPVMRIDFPLGQPGSPERIDGILGLPAFDGLLLVLDFGARRIELAHGVLAADAPGTLPFRLDGGMLPTLALRAGGVELEAHLDTGSPGILLVPNELAALLPTKGEPRVLGIARTPMGDAEIREVELAGAVEIGPLRVGDVRLEIADLPQIAGRGLGNVGPGLFGDARLTLDRASRLLRIELPGETGAADELEPELADLLARMSGDFDVEARLRVGAGDHFRALTGRATWAPADVGRWRRETFALDDPERGRQAGQAFLGPTGAPDHFELVQLDGFHASAVHVWGSWSAAERALVLETVVPRAAPAELVPAATRWIYRALEGDGFVKEVHRVEADGALRLASTYRYAPRR